MKTRHSSITRSLQSLVVTMKVEPDTDAERKLLISAFDHEDESLGILINHHIAGYVQQTFPGMKMIRADHEKYPTLMKVHLERVDQN